GTWVLNSSTKRLSIDVFELDESQRHSCNSRNRCARLSKLRAGCSSRIGHQFVAVVCGNRTHLKTQQVLVKRSSARGTSRRRFEASSDHIPCILCRGCRYVSRLQKLEYKAVRILNKDDLRAASDRRRCTACSKNSAAALLNPSDDGVEVAHTNLEICGARILKSRIRRFTIDVFVLDQLNADGRPRGLQNGDARL